MLAPMSRSVRLVLLSLTLFLVLFPLAAGRPGQPSTLKADEPAYFLMAMSLIEDGDLRCELKDIQRAFDHYPYLPLNNLILMTTDGWETVFFGKPYIYSLFAVPAAMLFGANDMGSLMLEENVVAEAGTVHYLTLDQIRGAIAELGFLPRQRNVFYELVDKNRERDAIEANRRRDAAALHVTA